MRRRIAYWAVCTHARYDRVSELVEDALANGAVAVTGGAPVAGTSGYFFQPTVLTNVRACTAHALIPPIWVLRARPLYLVV